MLLLLNDGSIETKPTRRRGSASPHHHHHPFLRARDAREIQSDSFLLSFNVFFSLFVCVCVCALDVYVYLRARFIVLETTFGEIFFIFIFPILAWEINSFVGERREQRERARVSRNHTLSLSSCVCVCLCSRHTDTRAHFLIR